MELTERAYDFSVRAAELVRYLREKGGAFPLADKLLDCGVCAGLAMRENDRGEAAAQIRRADYIIEMAAKSGYLTEIQARPLRTEARALLDALR